MINDASLLYMIVADGPHPTGENKTFGVNDPCSNLTTLTVHPSLISHGVGKQLSCHISDQIMLN